VLPLVSPSADSSSNYLAFGVTDEIINALMRIKGVRVTSRASAEDAQRSRVSLAKLADSLGVTHALEGTIQRQGTDVHVAVRLVNTADGLTAWSEVFDGTTNQVFEMQRYIAGAIAEAVSNDLGPRADSTLNAGAHQPTPEAHDAYLQAHYELSRRGDGDLTGAVAQLRKAVRIDSQYAVAWAELAQALTVLPLYGKGDPAKLQPEAMRAAERALAIDSSLAAAHAALGNLLNAQWRWQEGRVQLERAVALDSTYASAFQWLGENQLLNGDLSGAERSLAKAVRLDSTLSVTKAVHAVVLALLKRTSESDRLFAEAIARTPSVAALHVIPRDGVPVLESRPGGADGAGSGASHRSVVASGAGDVRLCLRPRGQSRGRRAGGTAAVGGSCTRRGGRRPRQDQAGHGRHDGSARPVREGAARA
jgi:TolB-like protein/Tfp pilus assembly protein PilF